MSNIVGIFSEPYSPVEQLEPGKWVYFDANDNPRGPYNTEEHAWRELKKCCEVWWERRGWTGCSFSDGVAETMDGSLPSLIPPRALSGASSMQGVPGSGCSDQPVRLYGHLAWFDEVRAEDYVQGWPF
jgi:hypothetical protein